MPSYSLQPVMQGLFILSLLVLIGCGVVDCIRYFDGGFLVLQGVILCLGSVICYFIPASLQKVKNYEEPVSP